ncbi:MAG: hypothetical protein EOM12_05265 [Verrucomicrobiae bacterium]|nr:hypothetical protein [Verrucomicrobiae bacterium]
MPGPKADYFAPNGSHKKTAPESGDANRGAASLRAAVHRRRPFNVAGERRKANSEARELPVLQLLNDPLLSRGWARMGKFLGAIK